jgi:YidC/Oxa1 family membrane protein insertase
MKELQKKYGHDRERLSQETMKLFKESGTNPMASCLPLLLQLPIFLALFQVINAASHGEAIGALTTAQAQSLQHAQIFGAHLADTFKNSGDIHVKILAAVLVVLMISTQFLSMRQLTYKNMTPEALKGSVAQQQKIMMYGLPLMLLFTGYTFPIALLIYWTTTNVWSMGQQFYVIRNNPSPGTPAFAAKQARDAAHAARKGQTTPVVEDAAEPASPEPPPARRQQPKRQSRSQRKGQSGPKDNS